MTINAPIGPPLLGALLRIPVDVIRQRMLDALHESGFTDLAPTHLIVLRYPSPDGRRPVEIAAYSGMSKQALNYQLGQLEQLGYLERRDDPDDGRFKRVYLTDRGHAVIHVMRTVVSDAEREWARELGAADLEQLRALLTRLVAILAR
jgi:DNA-binding MarR family transcriptional regulator